MASGVAEGVGDAVTASGVEVGCRDAFGVGSCETGKRGGVDESVAALHLVLSIGCIEMRIQSKSAFLGGF